MRRPCARLYSKSLAVSVALVQPADGKLPRRTSVPISAHMKIQSLIVFACGIACALTGACGADTPTRITGTMDIKSPADNSTVVLPANKQVPIEFTTNYQLRPKGMCAGV